MISLHEIELIGRFNKPHGIKGELSLTIDIDADAEELAQALPYVVVSIDGIFVPFFITAARPKTGATVLVAIEGINSESDAALLSNKEVYASRKILNEIFGDDTDEGADGDEEGLYAADLIGYNVYDHDTDRRLGMITGIEDSTANVLFIIQTPDDTTLYLPVADEWIVDIDHENQRVGMSLPEGITDL